MRSASRWSRLDTRSVCFEFHQKFTRQLPIMPDCPVWALPDTVYYGAMYNQSWTVNEPPEGLVAFNWRNLRNLDAVVVNYNGIWNIVRNTERCDSDGSCVDLPKSY